MYILYLVLSIIAVVLSPLAIDWYLSLREAQMERQAYQAAQKRKKGPQLVWASPRSH